MCGIVGYIGKNQAAPILLEGLSKLEYRGYDSAGIAVYNNNELEVAKSKGKLAVLSEKIDGGKKLGGNMGIGHTRWAYSRRAVRRKCSPSSFTIRPFCRCS